MAQRYDSEFGPIYIPGSYVSTKVEAAVRGLASTGVVAIFGESDGGIPGASEDNENNFYGPDQLGAIQSKYLSGPIVDGFRALVAAANDINIQGAVQRIYIYKTNNSLQADSEIENQGFGTFGTIEDKNYGQLGNLLYYQIIAAQSEVAPSTEPFTYIPSPSAASAIVRVNGGAAQTLSVSAKTAPSSLASSIEGLAGILAQGGVNRDILNGLSGQNITVSVSGAVATFTLAVGQVFASTPVVGDTLIVADAGDYGAVAESVYAGASNENRGAYVVTAVSNTTSSAFITATKARNDVVGALVNPAAVVATAVSVNEDDLICYSAIEMSDVTGDNRQVLTGLVGINGTVTVASSNLTFTLASGSVFDATPQVNDLVEIPSGSAFAGAGSANVGHYIVTAVSNTTSSAFITASRLSNGAPVAVGAAAIAAITDVQVLRPYKAGLGKAIEVSDNAGTDNISLLLRELGTTTSVDWISTSSVPVLLESSSEYIAQLNVNRQSDNINQQFQAGGDIAIKVGYLGTTASITIGASTITTSVSGGSGANLSMNIADFATISDLVSFIDSQTGYSAVVGNTLLGQQSPASLDRGTYGICSSVSASSHSGKIKRDYADWSDEVNGSTAITFAEDANAEGLPDVKSITYLSGGAKGGTTSASVVAALEAFEGIQTNFVVPLFSRDASEDIADGLTESSSAYTIDAIHQAVKDHVITMSTFKRKRNRQGVLSYRGSFLNAKSKANNMASARLSMVFQDFKGLNSDGVIEQFHPWYGACLAAGMQTAGFYKSITKKFINTSGVIQAAGDFGDNSMSQVEDALRNGLLIAERVPNNGIRWVSDQTSYSLDSNFVYNSIQAVYAADVVALSMAERLELAFVGQSLADVSNAVVAGFIQALMFEYLRLKLLAPSDDAPLGFKNLIIRVNGPIMEVSCEIKLATAIYFIPITLTISEIQRETIV